MVAAAPALELPSSWIEDAARRHRSRGPLPADLLALQQVLEDAIASLTAVQHEVVVLRGAYGLTFGDIALVLDTSEAATNAIYASAIDDLKRSLRGQTP